MTPGARGAVAGAAVYSAVFVVAFLYRFNALGGALGGFSNDEFGYLARARQIQAGEVPFRDFNDPGWFLADYVAAAAQWLGGNNLRSEALLTVGMLSLGAVLTFVLARRAAGSVLVALVAAAVQIALEPRHYNYPKIVLYAAGLALAWAYLDKPNRLRLGALGALTGVGFLFRHDHLAYLGALSLATIIVAHWPSLRDSLHAAVGLGAVTAIFVAPFLLFLALSGGVGEYFRSALVYVSRDAERTSFSLPRFSVDPSKPLLAMTRGETAAVATINVRWATQSDEQRLERESTYGLGAGAWLDGPTWSYRLDDVSRGNIESLVRDPLVEDTHGIDRARFALSPSEQPLRLESQLDTVQNATACLYYAFLAIPFIATAVLLKLQTAVTATQVLSSPRYVLPVIVLAVMLNAGFLSRGSTMIRIPDVGVTSALLLAWLTAVAVGRDAHVVARNGVARLLLRAGIVVLLCLTGLSVNGLAHASQTLRDAGLTRGPLAVAERAGTAWRALGRPPRAFAEDVEQPPALRVARYLSACTAPDDRLFVLGHYPELYYFADRRFAGGHAWLLPYYYSEDADEALIVERLKRARVPIVLTERRAEYDAEYRDVFEQVHQYLQAEYTEGGEVEFGGPAPLRVLVRADRQATRRYEPFDLPCFADATSAAR